MTSFPGLDPGLGARPITVPMPAGATPKTTGAARDDRLCVIVNSGSGAREAERIARLRDAFARHFPAGRWTIAAGGPDRIVPQTRAALAEGFGTIVACGGDGTIAAVADTLHATGAVQGAGAGTRLGVIPAGTFNFFARGLGIPQEIEPAVAVLAGGAARPVQVGTVNGRVFLNNASIGLYPRILREREAIYRRWGRSRFAAHWSVLRTVLTMRGGMDLTISDATGSWREHTPLAFVMNSPYQLDFLGIEGAERLRGGELALLIAPEASLGAILRGAIRLGARRAERHVDYRIRFAPAFTITPASSRLLTARDGERERMRTPLDYRALPGALCVIGPEAVARDAAPDVAPGAGDMALGGALA